MIFLFVTFILCLSFSPLAYIVSGKLNLKVNISDPFAGKPKAFNPIEYNPILANLPVKDIFAEDEIILITNRNINYLYSRNTIKNILSALILFSFLFGLVAYASLFLNNKIHNPIPVIAMYMGGHAPPLDQA